MITFRSNTGNSLFLNFTQPKASINNVVNYAKPNNTNTESKDSFIKKHKKEISIITAAILTGASIFAIIKYRNLKEIKSDSLPDKLNNNIRVNLVDKLKTIVKDQDKVSEIAEKVNNDNVFVLNEIVNNPQIYKIKKVEDVKAYLEHVKDKDLEFIKEQLLPEFGKYQNKLNFRKGKMLAETLGYIKPENIDTLGKVANNVEKLNLDNFGLWQFIMAIDSKNKNCIDLVAENARKLKLSECSDNEDFKKILDLGIKGITDLISKG